jgi:excinuclease ABC subunit C
MVVFEEGAPARQAYRKFKIRTVEGIDDFRSMHEVVTRRFRHLLDDDPSGRWARPDLVLIDGGKGQLGMAVDALRELGIDVPLFGLAKRFEEIYLPGRSEPVRLPAGSAALRLVQRVRDEAHRFANTFHGQQRAQRMTRSWLDEVPGIGPRRRQHLLQVFGSVEAMRKKQVQDLVEKGGLPRKLAETLYHLLQAQERS